MPLGIAGAVLLYRTDLPGRHLWRLLMLLTLFVPLPLFTSGWQTVLGSGGWLPLPAWSGGRIRGTGVSPVVRVDTVGTGHRLGDLDSCRGGAAVGDSARRPGVVLGRARAGGGCADADAGLAGAAACHAAARGAALGAAALWVSLQAATEISVTDVMQVRTFAEEVYTQIVGGPVRRGGRRAGRGGDAAVRAAVGGCWSAAWPAAGSDGCRRLRRERGSAGDAALDVRAGPLALAVGLLLGVLAGCLLAVPLGSLVWRAGLTSGTCQRRSAGRRRRRFIICAGPAVRRTA